MSRTYNGGQYTFSFEVSGAVNPENLSRDFFKNWEIQNHWNRFWLMSNTLSMTRLSYSKSMLKMIMFIAHWMALNALMILMRAGSPLVLHLHGFSPLNKWKNFTSMWSFQSSLHVTLPVNLLVNLLNITPIQKRQESLIKLLSVNVKTSQKYSFHAWFGLFKMV